jgi:endonuclease/exonuclease/phosphatase family metal-dependent hydrolase
MVRVASFNVENLFSRPKVFKTPGWNAAEPVLDAYREVNDLMALPVYSAADKGRIRDLLVTLDIYEINEHGAIRRKETKAPTWAWLRKNRGTFDRQPEDETESVEIVARGRDSWIGWVELARETTNEVGTRMTGRVVLEVGADVIAIVEAEDRPSLVRFNHDLLSGAYRHVMLVDGNDERGIDVGIMTRAGFDIEAIRSNVDTLDPTGEPLFSRDCAQFELRTPADATLHVLVNHFKSQSGGGGLKRRRQAAEVRRIVDGLVAAGRHVVVLGDLNEGSTAAGSPPANLADLFDPLGPLLSCYDLHGFDVGPRLGSFDDCSLRNRLDYVLISRSLEPAFAGGALFRKGLWGSRVTRPTNWPTYPDMTARVEQASDHAAIYVDLDL